MARQPALALFRPSPADLDLQPAKQHLIPSFRAESGPLTTDRARPDLPCPVDPIVRRYENKPTVRTADRGLFLLDREGILLATLDWARETD